MGEAAIMEVERRLLAAGEARLAVSGVGAGAGTLHGYAAVFDSLSEDLGGFREIIRPSAFNRALRERQPVVALLNHDPSKVLGATRNGTLQLAVDPRGLKAAIRPPDTPTAEEVRTLVRGDFMGGMSFAFRVPRGGDTWRSDAAGEVREVHDADIFDVSIVTVPAYSATTVSARARRGRSGDVPNELNRLLLLIS
jgi:hypothetical protein